MIIIIEIKYILRNKIDYIVVKNIFKILLLTKVLNNIILK